jgi:hypothetical protein
MYALLNNDELAIPLADRMIARHFRSIRPDWEHTNQYVDKCKQHLADTGLLDIDFKIVRELISRDMKIWRDRVNEAHKSKYRKLIKWLSETLDSKNIDRKYLVDLCVNSKRSSFIKTMAPQFDDKIEWVTCTDNIGNDKPIILRNVINNENILSYKLQQEKPFWFVDSGYTNFITGKKARHRLVANHIHHAPAGKSFPADRLCNLPSFPKPWRKGGNRILIVESSEKHYELFNDNLPAWRHRVKTELSQFDEFVTTWRPKEPDRKTRTKLYDILQEESDDLYCVITDASAAAIEAIWCGIPVITLNKHITNPVSRSSISDLRDLYRGPIGDWLCALTYSEFTTDELHNGKARKLIRKFYGV